METQGKGAVLAAKAVEDKSQAVSYQLRVLGDERGGRGYDGGREQVHQLKSTRESNESPRLEGTEQKSRTHRRPRVILRS